MAPYRTLSPRYYECDPGYQWYTCNMGGLSYAGCCSIDPCSSVTFCPSQNQDPRSAGPNSAPTTSVSSAAAPRPTYQTLNDHGPPVSSTGDYGTAAAMSSPTNNNSTSQATVAIAATVGTLLGLGLIAFCLWRRARTRRRAREAKEAERRYKKERPKAVYAKAPSPGSSISSSDRRRGGSHRTWSSTTVLGDTAPSLHGYAYQHPPTEFGHPYTTKPDYGNGLDEHFPSPPPATKQHPTRERAKDRRRRTVDTRRFGVVPPRDLRPDSSSPPLDDEANRRNRRFRRRSAISFESTAVETGCRLTGEDGHHHCAAAAAPSSYASEPKTAAAVDPLETVHRPVGYRGGGVTPVYGRDGMLEELYVPV